MGAKTFTDGFSFRGEIRIEIRDRNGHLLNVIEDKNFIVTLGLEAAIDILDGTNSGHKFFRMAIGDSGTLTGQPYVPKSPDATWPVRTTLFYEIFRKNIDTNTQPTSTSMRFLTSFASADVTASSFSTSPKVVNEAGLIISDGTQTGNDEIPQGYVPDATEKLFSLRTFKSQAFDPADTLTLTIAWTIYAQ